MITINKIYKNGTCLMALALGLTLTSCNDFLEEHVPQGTVSDEQALQTSNVESMVVSAYAGLSTIEDINASFSLWNYDLRSDDAYKGGSNEGDGDVFNKIETGNGIMPSDWSIDGEGGIWARFYNFISRANTALAILDNTDDSYAQKKERIAEMKFLRAYGHFQLKRLFKNIPFVMDEHMTSEQFYQLSNTEYSNDEAWEKIASEVKAAYNDLPVTQKEKGRPTKAAAAAFLAKVYLYKAYHQDEPRKHTVTSVNTNELDSVLKYTDYKGELANVYEGYQLEADFHNNFRPEEAYENGCESLWAVQYSFNDGSVNGNRNFGAALMAPNVESATTGGHDFYKPSQNLVNAFKTDGNGLPMLNSFNASDYDVEYDNVDPRLFLTVGMPGFPFMFNSNFIQEKSWARNSTGLYGYYITLKQNVDLAYVGENTYIKKCGWCWANSMNRIVFRMADVMLMRAEALAQRGKSKDAINIVNDIRRRAAASVNMIAGYKKQYGVKFNVGEYDLNAPNALDIVKFERRLELAMEAERFFDLVRWGDVKKVLDKFYADEQYVSIYKNSNFKENVNEYMPIPFTEMKAADGKYTQNPGF